MKIWEMAGFFQINGDELELFWESFAMLIILHCR